MNSFDESSQVSPSLTDSMVNFNFCNYNKDFLDSNTFNFQDKVDGGYDSDGVGSDIEELMYISIHHQTVDTMELSFNPHLNNNKEKNNTLSDNNNDNFQIGSQVDLNNLKYGV